MKVKRVKVEKGKTFTFLPFYPFTLLPCPQGAL